MEDPSLSPSYDDIFLHACTNGMMHLLLQLIDLCGGIYSYKLYKVMTADCFTALSHACLSGHIEIVAFIMEYYDLNGLTVKALSSDDHSAFKLACSNEHVAVVKLLVSYYECFRDELNDALQAEDQIVLLYARDRDFRGYLLSLYAKCGIRAF